jgi:SAM domain (Sterile alpha motif)
MATGAASKGKAVDIAAWLRSLGLEEYEQAFRDNAVDGELLPALTDEHLKELGLPLGHRLKLLNAIAALHIGAAEQAPAGTSPRTTVSSAASNCLAGTALAASRWRTSPRSPTRDCIFDRRRMRWSMPLRRPRRRRRSAMSGPS